MPAQKVGRLILLDMESSESPVGRTVLYAPVSSHDQRGDSTARWPPHRVTTRRGLPVDEVVTEVGSGKASPGARDPTALTVVSSTVTASPASG